GELRRIADEMETLARERIGTGDIRMHHSLEVRYTGQDFSLPVSVDPRCYDEDYPDAVRNALHQLHQKRFGYHDADLSLEIVNVHLAATAPTVLDRLPPPARREGPALLGRRRGVFDRD